MAFKCNLERLTLSNSYYRKVIFTSKQQQLVLMKLKPKQEIGSEVHPNTSQFIRVESGNGTAIISGKKYRLSDGSAVLIPSGKRHNIIAGNKGLKLYTIYSPPEHDPNTLEKVKINDY